MPAQDPLLNTLATHHMPAPQYDRPILGPTNKSLRAHGTNFPIFRKLIHIDRRKRPHQVCRGIEHVPGRRAGREVKEGESADLHVDAEVSAADLVDLVGWLRRKRGSRVGAEEFADVVGDGDGDLDGAGVGVGAGAGVRGLEIGDDVIELLV